MPEGDTIFRAARTLNRALGDKAVTRFESTYPLLTRFNEDSPLIGQTVEQVESRGKWMLIHFSGGATLVTHMLMSGSWHIYRPGERWQQPRRDMRIVLETADFVAVGFRVPIAEMHSPRSLARERRIPGTAVDLLNPAFDASAALQRMMARGDEELGVVLLHQRVLAGIGNVFKSEACFAAGLNPFRRIATISQEQAAEIISIARRQLGFNVQEDMSHPAFQAKGRRTTNEMDPSASLWVYGRAGDSCRKCGEPIETRRQGSEARVTFWCPHCQPMVA